MLHYSLFRHASLLVPALAVLLGAQPALATDCCTASELDPVVKSAGPLVIWAARPPVLEWMYHAPAGGLPKRVLGGRMFNYMAGRHLWLMGGVRTVPTGLPLTAETSNADRNSFSQAGLGLGYMLSPTVRAISSWNTGFGRFSVSPGSQFTMGVALRR